MASSGSTPPEKPTICLQSSLPLLEYSNSAEIKEAVQNLKKMYTESDSVNKQLIDQIQSLVSKLSGSRQTTAQTPLISPLSTGTPTTTQPPLVNPLSTGTSTTAQPPLVNPLSTAAPSTVQPQPISTTPLGSNEEINLGTANNDFSNINLSLYGGGRRKRAHTSARRNYRNRRKTVKSARR